MKPITIAIAGCGSRGMQAYAPQVKPFFPAACALWRRPIFARGSWR